MLLSKSHKHAIIGLIVMGVALITFAYPYSVQHPLDIMRGLQLTATVALLFGIFKKDPLHKDKLVLFWLAITTALFTSLVICSFRYIAEDFESYRFTYFLTSLMALLGEWAATAVVGYSMYLIYQEYVELVQNNRVAGLTLPGANVINPIFETKETPPPYMIPTSENMSVSIQN